MQSFDNSKTIQNSKFKINSWYISLLILSCLVLTADWFFYNHRLGITIPLFMSLLGIAGMLVAKKALIAKAIKTDFVILIASLLPLIEELNVLTFFIGSLGLVNFTLNQSKVRDFFTLDRASLVVLFVVILPFKFLFDIVRLQSIRKRLHTHQSKLPFLKHWALPLLMTGGFLFLFTIANPLIGNWMLALDLRFLLKIFNLERIIFWTFIAIISWPFLKPSLQRLRRHIPATTTQTDYCVETINSQNQTLNEATVFRSLILFNLLFLVQTFLDFKYLWIGQTLPAGVTFSQYVHHGTYVLIFTTLLAASFILFVTSAKKRLEKSPRIMGLILAWIVQNIVLVLSNVQRMELYIEAFALTYQRLAVLIWLALVIIGLVLIIIRLFKARSNIWLIKANLISLCAVLYITSFANLPYLIADYNYTASQKNVSKPLDINYVVRLGPNTIPVLDKIMADSRWSNITNKQAFSVNRYKPRKSLIQIRRNFVQKLEREYSDWRQWNFRDQRLVKSILPFEPNVLPK